MPFGYKSRWAPTSSKKSTSSKSTKRAVSTSRPRVSNPRPKIPSNPPPPKNQPRSNPVVTPKSGYRIGAVVRPNTKQPVGSKQVAKTVAAPRPAATIPTKSGYTIGPTIRGPVSAAGTKKLGAPVSAPIRKAVAAPVGSPRPSTGGGTVTRPTAPTIRPPAPAPTVRPPAPLPPPPQTVTNPNGPSNIRNFTARGGPGTFGRLQRQRMSRGPRSGVSLTPEMLRRLAAQRIGYQ